MGVKKPPAVGFNTLTENEQSLTDFKKTASPTINAQSSFTSKSTGVPMQIVPTGLQNMIAKPVQVNVALPLAPVAQRQMDFWAAGRDNKLILEPAKVNAEPETVWPLPTKSHASSAHGPAAYRNSPANISRSMPLHLKNPANSLSGVVTRQSINNCRAISLHLNPQIRTPVETEVQGPINERVKPPTVTQTRRLVKAKTEVKPLVKGDASAFVTAEVESKDDKNVGVKREEVTDVHASIHHTTANNIRRLAQQHTIKWQISSSGRRKFQSRTVRLMVELLQSLHQKLPKKSIGLLA